MSFALVCPEVIVDSNLPKDAEKLQIQTSILWQGVNDHPPNKLIDPTK